MGRAQGRKTARIGQWSRVQGTGPGRRPKHRLGPEDMLRRKAVRTRANVLQQGNLKRAVNTTSAGKINKYLRVPERYNNPTKTGVAGVYLVKTGIAANLSFLDGTKRSQINTGKIPVMVRFSKQTEEIHIQTIDGKHKYELRIMVPEQQKKFYDNLMSMLDPSKRTQRKPNLTVEV